MPKQKGDKNRKKYGESTDIYEYVKRNKDRMPDYWQDKGTRVCIDGVCCMIARDKFTDAEIAEYYGCPVPLVDAIRNQYKAIIRNLKKEHEEAIMLFGDLYTGKPEGANDDLGYVEILSMMLGG